MNALDRLRQKDIMKLTPLEWCIISLDRTGTAFELVLDAAEELEKLQKVSE